MGLNYGNPYSKNTTDLSIIDTTTRNRPKSSSMVKRVPSPVLGFNFTGGIRSRFQEPEYDLSEAGKIIDTESYAYRAYDKKIGNMFKQGWNWVGMNPRVVNYIKSRVSQIEEASGMPFELLLRETAEDFIQKHNAFLVKVRNIKSSGGKIRTTPSGRSLKPVAAYFRIPAESIEFIKNENNGKVTKWRQHMPDGRTKEFSPIDIIHFFNRRKGGFVIGTPPLTSVKEDIRALRRIEENVDMLLYQYLFPLFHYKVGTKEVPARIYPNGNSEVDEVDNQIRLMPAEGIIVTSERHEIKAIGAEGNAINAEPYLKYFRSRVFSGLGTSDVDMGHGDLANRATAETMSTALLDDVKNLQIVFALMINEFIVKELLLESSFKFDVLLPENRVWFVFKEIDLEWKIKKENHASLLYSGNSITEDELREELSREPVKDEEREKMHIELVAKELLETEGEVNKGIAEIGAATRVKSQIDNPTTRSQRAKQQPTNQHGTLSGPSKRQSSMDFEDGAVINLYSMLWDDIFNHVNASDSINTAWISQQVNMANTKMRENFTNEMMKNFWNSFGTKTDSSMNLIVKELFDRFLSINLDKFNDKMKENIIKTLNSTDNSDKISVINSLRAVFDSNEFRTRFIEDFWFKKASSLGSVMKFKNEGIDTVEIVLNPTDTTCETCKAKNGELISLNGFSLFDLTPFHSGCECNIEAI